MVSVGEMLVIIIVSHINSLDYYLFLYSTFIHIYSYIHLLILFIILRITLHSFWFIIIFMVFITLCPFDLILADIVRFQNNMIHWWLKWNLHIAASIVFRKTKFISWFPVYELRSGTSTLYLCKEHRQLYRSKIISIVSRTFTWSRKSTMS